MTIDEAINHCEEVAKEQDKLCKRYDDASGYTRSHNEDIRTTDAKRCEECSKEHRQLAEWLKNYKRLLAQEPCGKDINVPATDTISRQEVNKLLRDMWVKYMPMELDVNLSFVLGAIDEIESVTPARPKSEWIPVSERLPEEDGCYLVTTTGTNNDIIDIAYYTDGIWHKASRIKAWMSLPQPYKAESEG